MRLIPFPFFFINGMKCTTQNGMGESDTHNGVEKWHYGEMEEMLNYSFAAAFNIRFIVRQTKVSLCCHGLKMAHGRLTLSAFHYYLFQLILWKHFTTNTRTEALSHWRFVCVSEPSGLRFNVRHHRRHRVVNEQKVPIWLIAFLLPQISYAVCRLWWCVNAKILKHPYRRNVRFFRWMIHHSSRSGLSS